MRLKYRQLEEKVTQIDLDYKKDVARLGRRLDCLSPFLCGVAGCMRRKKVSLMEDIDDESFTFREDNEQKDEKE